MELFLAPVKLNISGTKAISLVPEFSFYYQQPIVAPELEFNCHFSFANSIDLNEWSPVFSGESFEEAIIPYKWQILKNQEALKLHITFFDHPTLTQTAVSINPQTKIIQIQLVSNSVTTIEIDPLFHPLGSLLMIYLAHYSGGMLIHASGIQDCSNGYLFTGVSGIGKSTMSSLWKKKGATVINDDRLWLYKINGIWHVFNTPMQYYAQQPLMAPLRKAFLLRQSPENKYAVVSGAQGSMRLMANCIQHLYNKEMIAAHLDRIVDFTANVPVYDLGFKPDTEVVDLIRGMF